MVDGTGAELGNMVVVKFAADASPADVHSTSGDGRTRQRITSLLLNHGPQTVAELAGALALGNLLIELYRGRSSTDRPGVEVLGGRQVLTSDLHIGAGWVAGVVALVVFRRSDTRQVRTPAFSGVGG